MIHASKTEAQTYFSPYFFFIGVYLERKIFTQAFLIMYVLY